MPEIYSSVISLIPLLNFASGDLTASGMYGRSSKGREYGKLASKISSEIDAAQGFYVWGFYEPSGLWRSLYVGKAGFAKTASLRARITEELKDERAFAWCGKHTGLAREDCKRLWQRFYPPSVNSRAPDNHIERALRKDGSTHIVWASVPELANDQVRFVEADLIETLNPVSNVQRPAPNSELLDITIEVIRSFKRMIHKGRR